MLICRDAKHSDIDVLIDIRKILLSSGEGYYSARNDSEESQWKAAYKQWLENNLDKPNIKILVAVWSSELVGCCIGIIDERVPFRGCLNGKMGWGQSMIVIPTHRRRGIAKQMMRELCQWFKQQGVEKFAFQSTPMALSIYKNWGCKDSGEPLLIKEL